MKPKEDINKSGDGEIISCIDIDKKVLFDMDIAISNYRKGEVSQPIDLSGI